jgi:hypothetical protein
MQPLVDRVFLMKRKEELGLPAHQVCLLIMDVWPVHMCAESRGYISDKYLWILVKYIPAGYTSIKQPCDVGLQKPLKDAARSCFASWITYQVSLALKDGVLPQNVSIYLRMSWLRPIICKVF